MTATKLETTIKAFWKWFASVSGKLDSSDFSDTELVAELDRRLFNIDSRINWEIGPGIRTSCQLVLSPNFSDDLVPICRTFLDLAPPIKNWTFLLYKPRKDWHNELTVEDAGGQSIQLDTNGWTYVLLRYPDGDSEILIAANEALPFEKESRLRWLAGALVLEALLGEEVVMKHVQTWELVDYMDGGLSADARELRQLPDSFNLEER